MQSEASEARRARERIHGPRREPLELADVLIADDDADAVEALREVMTLEGHEVRVAYDGGEGLAALATRIPDVVLLDVEMPVLDGPDMANEMGCPEVVSSRT
jgi:CheY-like chemotaxis protein